MRVLLAAATALLMSAPAVSQPAGDDADQSKVEADPAAAAIVADCSARKFETSVELVRDGKKRVTRLKLCSTAGSDNAAWVKTLQDAKTKIAANPEISDESKAKIATEIDVEVAKFNKVETAIIALPKSAPPPASRLPDYGSYPALPTAPAAAAASSAATSRSLAKPRLTILCLEEGEKGDGSACRTLERGTRLSIRADENLAGNVALRFLRRGDERGELALAGMQRGQSLRSKLPPELCNGVATSQVEIQVVGGGQVAETLGPYKLRC